MLKDIDSKNVELNEKVKHFKRYRKNELGWFQQFDNVNLNAGDCDINTAAFNNGFGDGQAMSESFDDIDYQKNLSTMSDDQIIENIQTGID